MNYRNKYRNPIENAKEIIKKDSFILDTETTGIMQNDEIVEIAIIDIHGDVLVNTLIKPVKSIPLVATKIHGITNKDVSDSLTMDTIWGKHLKNILSNHLVSIYNSDFDIRLIRQSLRSYSISMESHQEVICIMKLYAEFRGICDDYHNHFKWFKLSEAVRDSNIRTPKNIHRALTDAELTRKLIYYIASQG